MSVVGLHPEELFDKLLDGELTPTERERLRAHLGACEVCRFEHAVRFDFQQEALSLSSVSPPLMPLRAAPVTATPPRRRRSRRLVWGLAAAAVITASGAVASVVVAGKSSGAVSLLFSRSASPAERSRSIRAKQPARAVGPGAAAAPPALAPPAFAAPPDALAAEGQPVARGARASSGHAARARAPLKGASTPPERAMKEEAASPASEPAVKEPVAATQLFAEANQARRSGDIGRASGLYHLLQDQFPGSAEAELSRVTLALLLLDSGDAQGALTGFERYLAGSSRGLEAEALVGRARALGHLGRRDLEATAWQEVQRKYPRSIYGRQASERLLALGQP